MVSGVGVVDKAAVILDALEDGPRSLAGLVDATGMSRATTHRLATALEAHGLLRRDEAGRFALGLWLASLGRAATAQVPLATVAEEAMAELREATGESVQIFVRRGDLRVCIASLESPHGLRTIVPTGAALPLGVGSAGRILAPGWQPGAQRRHEASAEEREPGVASVSAPVCAPDGTVVAAIGISGPVGRLTRRPGRRHGAAVEAAAAAVETAVGLRSPVDG
jgi:DNA-binding IclR family transcriptional regulator